MATKPPRPYEAVAARICWSGKLAASSVLVAELLVMMTIPADTESAGMSAAKAG